jgi:hypothetical protein
VALVENSDNNVLEAYGTDGTEDCIVRRGFRGDKYVATFKFKWNGNTWPGSLVRWLSPGTTWRWHFKATARPGCINARPTESATPS